MLDQTAAHLPDRVFLLVPRPMQLGQRGLNDACGHEFQEHLCRTEKERPPSDTLSAPPHVMTQAQFFDFIEVDFDLLATHVSLHCFLHVQL